MKFYELRLKTAALEQFTKLPICNTAVGVGGSKYRKIFRPRDILTTLICKY
jgi:hypothetical protein